MTVLSNEVLKWLTDCLRTEQRVMLGHFTLHLPGDDVMATICTPAQLQAARDICTWAETSILPTSFGHHVSIKARNELPVRISFQLDKSSFMFMPRDDVAQANFDVNKSDAAEQIQAQAVLWRDVCEPWAQAVDALNALNHYAETPEQMAFYAPWLSTLIDKLVHTSGSKTDYPGLGVTTAKRSNSAMLKRLHKPKKIGSYLSFTREQRAYLNIGTQALAQLTMLGEAKRAPFTLMTYVMLATSRGPLLDEGPFERHESVRLYY